jgi:SAM-dependent methyltransferase
MPTAAHVTPYDDIRYPGLPCINAHPDHLAATATLHGMTPASPDRCRVLEVGCGDGGNLVAMAYALPSSTFVGIDLAGEAIQAARAFARRVGITNVTFEAQDLAQFPESAGAFDYIVAHGVYSWIPPAVRDALLALVGRHLASQGVAFVSYNTYPGCHVRQMMWEMLKFHTAELDDPQARLTEARALIRLVAHGTTQPGEYAQPLVEEARRMEDRVPALLFHDDLSPVNDPVYFHAFAEHAALHGLQFLAEASFVSSSYAGIAPEARAALDTLDPMTREQYLDFIKCRRFRETLLCRDEVGLERSDAAGRLRSLLFTAARLVRSVPQDKAAEPETTEASAGETGGDAGTRVMMALLDVLRAAAPHALPLEALVDTIRALPEGDRASMPAEADPLAIVLASLRAGVIEPHVIAPRLAFPPGERPTASAVVRAQLAGGELVTSLSHRLIKIDDDIAKRLLPLLDGTRDRRELLAATGELAGPEKSAAANLDQHLHRLARLGLMIA